MNDKYKNRDDRMKDIRRYLDGRMSGRERNKFEKNLQGDPFEEEAMEGFDSLSADELSKDIRSLRSKLKGKYRKRTPLYYRIAAAVVVLLAISSLLLLKELNKPDMLVSDNLGIEKDTVVEIASEPVTTIDEASFRESDPPDQKAEVIRAEGSGEKGSIDEIAEEVIASPSEVLEKEAEIILDYMEEADMFDTIMTDKELKLAEPKAAVVQEKNELNQAKGYVTEERKVSAARSKKAAEANPPVSVVEKVAGEVAGIAVTEESVVSDDQIIELQEAEAISADLSDKEALPYGGMREFKKYLQTDQIFPPGWEGSDKEIVKIEITIGVSGKIEDIEVIKSPDKRFSDEAIRLIEEGPPWNAATRDSQRIEESVSLRIIFKR